MFQQFETTQLTATRDSFTVTHDDGFRQVIPTLLTELVFAEARFTDVAPRAVRQDEGNFVYAYPTFKVGGADVHPTLTIGTSSDGLVRCFLDLAVDGNVVTLHKLTILRFRAAEAVIESSADTWQSWPLFGDHFFYGVEYPVATSAVASGTVSLGHMPGKRIQDGETFRSHGVVIGPVANKAPMEALKAYFWALRVRPSGNHVNYNPWWSMESPFGEKDCLCLIDRILPEGDTAGPRYDSVAFDMGWSARDAIWRVDPERFPNGLAPVSEALVARGSGLGLWWSPSNWYSPSSFDNEWAATQGYETETFANPAGADNRFACLAAGTQYQRETLASLQDIASSTALAHLKADGYTPDCSASDHGHLPNELSREAIAAGIIEIFEMLRTEQPGVWIEATCMGAGSPWWLLWADTIIGGFGQDVPFGVVPSPTYRESYTSARDFYVLSGRQLNPVTPVSTQEALGIVHQTTEPLYNDAVVTALRGHSFLPLYVNPGITSSQECEFLGKLTRWFQANTDQLLETVPIFPSEWPPGNINWEHSMCMRVPYGFAHPSSSRTLVVLRNPWIETATVTVPVDALPKGQVSVVQLYPCPRGVARHVESTDGIAVALSGYETKVLAIERGSTGITIAPDPAVGALDGLRDAEGAILDTVDGFSATVSADLEGSGWELHLLLEKPTDFSLSSLTVMEGARTLETSIVDSAAGWSKAETWMEFNHWNYVTIQLGTGHHEITVHAIVSTGVVRVSGWIVRRLLIESDSKTEQEVRRQFNFPVPAFPSITAARGLFTGDIARSTSTSLAVASPPTQAAMEGGAVGLTNKGIPCWGSLP